MESKSRTEVSLNNGKKIPVIGVGTYLMRDEQELKEIIGQAFHIGYRLIDTAKVYRNESIIGDIMADLGSYGLQREDVFLTTKLSTADQGKGNCKKAILEAFQKLQVSYIDLVLIHFPGSNKLSPDDERNAENRKGSWQDLEELYHAGLVKSIGVSNYTVKHLQEMLTYAKVKPAVNQVEVHPLFYDFELIEFCQENSIIVQAYSSLGGKDGWPVMCEDEILIEMSQKYGKSIAQILLRWALQHKLCIIPKTCNVDNLRKNYDLFNFNISSQDMDTIDGLSRNQKFCWNPIHIR